MKALKIQKFKTVLWIIKNSEPVKLEELFTSQAQDTLKSYRHIYKAYAL